MKEMKRKYSYLLSWGIFIIMALLISVKGFAQDSLLIIVHEKVNHKMKKVDIDSTKNWTRGGVFNVNVGQGTQGNWAAGGDDFSFSVSSYFGYYVYYLKDRISWDNTISLNYGLVNTTSQGTRKNDDRIDFLSKIGYEMQSKLNLAGVFNFHSQFSKGFSYTDTGSSQLLSNFMSPGYFLFSLGLDYKPAKGFSVFISPISSRWTVVSNDSLSYKGAYGVAPGEKAKNEIGAFITTNYTTNLNKVLTYSGRLDLFSNYQHNPENVDVMMNNLFSAKVSKLLSASLNIDLIYDDDVKLFGENHDAPGWQFKSLIAAGLSVKL